MRIIKSIFTLYVTFVSVTSLTCAMQHGARDDASHFSRRTVNKISNPSKTIIESTDAGSVGGAVSRMSKTTKLISSAPRLMTKEPRNFNARLISLQGIQTSAQAADKFKEIIGKQHDIGFIDYNGSEIVCQYLRAYEEADIVIQRQENIIRDKDRTISSLREQLSKGTSGEFAEYAGTLIDIKAAPVMAFAQTIPNESRRSTVDWDMDTNVTFRTKEISASAQILIKKLSEEGDFYTGKLKESAAEAGREIPGAQYISKRGSTKSPLALYFSSIDSVCCYAVEFSTLGNMSPAVLQAQSMHLEQNNQSLFETESEDDPTPTIGESIIQMFKEDIDMFSTNATQDATDVRKKETFKKLLRTALLRFARNPESREILHSLMEKTEETISATESGQELTKHVYDITKNCGSVFNLFNSKEMVTFMVFSKEHKEKFYPSETYVFRDER